MLPGKRAVPGILPSDASSEKAASTRPQDTSLGVQAAAPRISRSYGHALPDCPMFAHARQPSVPTRFRVGPD